MPGGLLENPCIPLQPPHVLDDLRNLLARYAGYRQHVAEPPVVCRHAELHRAEKGEIAVMARLVDLVHERWSLIGPPGRFAVTLYTALDEKTITRGVLCRCGRRRRKGLYIPAAPPTRRA